MPQELLGLTFEYLENTDLYKCEKLNLTWQKVAMLVKVRQNQRELFGDDFANSQIDSRRKSDLVDIGLALQRCNLKMAEYSRKYHEVNHAYLSVKTLTFLLSYIGGITSAILFGKAENASNMDFYGFI